jgi:hypothetical protein
MDLGLPADTEIVTFVGRRSCLRSPYVTSRSFGTGVLQLTQLTHSVHLWCSHDAFLATLILFLISPVLASHRFVTLHLDRWSHYPGGSHGIFVPKHNGTLAQHFSSGWRSPESSVNLKVFLVSACVPVSSIDLHLSSHTIPLSIYANR